MVACRGPFNQATIRRPLLFMHGSPARRRLTPWVAKRRRNRRYQHSRSGDGAGISAASKVQLEWDESAAELRINGHTIEDCPHWIILKTGTDESTFKRNSFIYTKCMLNVRYDRIADQILATDPTWEPILSVPGVRAAALRFAKKFGLPKPSPRQSMCPSPQ